MHYEYKRHPLEGVCNFSLDNGRSGDIVRTARDTAEPPAEDFVVEEDEGPRVQLEAAPPLLAVP